MRKCPDCGSALTEVSEITGLPNHTLLYWCGKCGVLAHEDSDRELFFCAPGVMVAPGVNGVMPVSMLSEDAQRMVMGSNA